MSWGSDVTHRVNNKLPYVQSHSRASAWEYGFEERKRACIGLEAKLKVIDEISKGQSQRHASEIFGIPKSTVADVWKHRDKIKDHVFAAEAPEEYAKKRRIIRDPHFSQLARSCYVWFTQQRSAKVTHSQAYDALATVLEWLEEQDNVTLEHLL